MEQLNSARRRQFLKNWAYGFGSMALGDLLVKDGYAAASNPLAPKAPHFKGKAKSVIFLFMEGGPSQLDLFDPKPELAKWDGKPLPASLTKDLQLAFIKPTAAVLAAVASSARMANPAWKSATTSRI